MKMKAGKATSKIRSNAGETITETLVALLIAALALVMLAGVISAASRMVTASREKLNTYFESNNTMMEMTDPTGTATIDIKVDGGTGKTIKEKVYYYSNSSLDGSGTGSDTVIAYKLKPEE